VRDQFRPIAEIMIKLKRAYEAAGREDGIRFLVERLWPRGVKKGALRLDAWLKDVASSTALRQWFGHDPVKWPEFQRLWAQEHGYVKLQPNLFGI
jgi:uncharacterized protein YeaO (DUF488 family)